MLGYWVMIIGRWDCVFFYSLVLLRDTIRCFGSFRRVFCFFRLFISLIRISIIMILGEGVLLEED